MNTTTHAVTTVAISKVETSPYPANVSPLSIPQDQYLAMLGNVDEQQAEERLLDAAADQDLDALARVFDEIGFDG